MIYYLARKATDFLIEKSEKNRDIERDIEVGFRIIINFLVIITLSLPVSFLLETVVPTIVAMISIGVLRYFTGGRHFKSSDICALYTSAIFVTTPLISKMVEDHDYLRIIFGIMSLLLVILFAPLHTKGISDRNRQRNKIMSLVIILVSILFIKSMVISIALLIQSLDLIRFEGHRGK